MTLGQLLFELCVTQKENGRTDAQMDKGKSKYPYPYSGGTNSSSSIYKTSWIKFQLYLQNFL
jgi:hypothetical protein